MTDVGTLRPNMPLIRSWLESANRPDTEFPLNNLPHGVFSRGDDGPRLCIAIGDFALDIAPLAEAGRLPFAEVLRAPRWNAFMALGPTAWDLLRSNLTDVLREGAQAASVVSPHLVPLSEVTLHLPFAVTEYTDFYAGRHHAENVGTMFRGVESALPPSWLHMPIGYNGRASSVVVSGTPVRRPRGQLKARDDATPRFAPSERFDFELEMGAVVGCASDGPLTVPEADASIFGYVLLNDWSARDIQSWEYQPLGPFQSKATATTISPWIVPKAALAPFRIPSSPRAVPILEYLAEHGPMLHDIALEAELTPQGGEGTVIARTGMRELYWSPAQQLAHHTSSGCPMRVGDLIGTGTISGSDRGARGSMLELSWNGADPLVLRGGERRTFLEDGDTITLRGHANGDGYRIGFGDCAGTILPARDG